MTQDKTDVSVASENRSFSRWPWRLAIHAIGCYGGGRRSRRRGCLIASLLRRGRERDADSVSCPRIPRMGLLDSRIRLAVRRRVDVVQAPTPLSPRATTGSRAGGGRGAGDSRDRRPDRGRSDPDADAPRPAWDPFHCAEMGALDRAGLDARDGDRPGGLRSLVASMASWALEASVGLDRSCWDDPRHVVDHPLRVAVLVSTTPLAIRKEREQRTRNPGNRTSQLLSRKADPSLKLASRA